jgi:hypothetical protein
MYIGGVTSTGASSAVAYIFRNVNGTWTSLFSQSIASSASGTLRFEAVGPSLKLFLNGNLVAFSDDNQLTSGTVGMRTSTGAAVANFSASTLTLNNNGNALPFGDTFSAATNQQLSSSWLNQAGSFQVGGGSAMAIGGSQVTVNGVPDPNVNLATVNGISATNATVQADVTLAVGQAAGLVARYTGTGDQNMYLGAAVNVGHNSFLLVILSNVNGTWTVLRSVTQSASANSGFLKFVVLDNNLQLFFNGNLALSFTDSSISGAGTVGIRASVGAVLQNFQAN